MSYTERLYIRPFSSTEIFFIESPYVSATFSLAIFSTTSDVSSDISVSSEWVTVIPVLASLIPITLTVYVAVCVPTVPVMVVLPVLRPVTSPFSSTDAISGSAELQATFLSSVVFDGI